MEDKINNDGHKSERKKIDPTLEHEDKLESLDRGSRYSDKDTGSKTE
jgi:hypothetical protein